MRNPFNPRKGTPAYNSQYASQRSNYTVSPGGILRRTPSSSTGVSPYIRPSSTPRGTVPGYSASNFTFPNRSVRTRVPGIKGTKRKTKSMIVKPISKKPKINKKFRAKVQKCLTYNDPWALYESVHNIRLHQSEVDEYEVFYEDERSRLLSFNDNYETLHHASVLFSNKTDTDDYTTFTNNFETKIKLSQIYYHASFFFKSTSTHVVNIEMYICTPKISMFESAQTLVDGSYAGQFIDFNETSFGQAGLNSGNLHSKASDWLALHERYRVKKVIFKLQPGDYTSYMLKLPNNQTIDFSDEGVATTGLRFRKRNSRVVFFRVINDISVSTTVGETDGRIHAFPSNAQGGVACRFKRTAMYRPLPVVDTIGKPQTSRNTIRRSNWSIAGGNDQQVVFQNPLNTTSGP